MNRRSAAEAFAAAMADLRRAQPMLTGPLTAERQRTLLTRIDAARAALGEARLALARQEPDADPLPDRAAGTNVVRLGRRA